MEDYKTNFTQFEQVTNPIVKLGYISKGTYQLGLSYRNINRCGNHFIVKFKIISPMEDNHREAVEIIHGYHFTIGDHFMMDQNSKKLADFFAFLITQSLLKVNEIFPEKEIEIPPHDLLQEPILIMLLSRNN